MIYFTEIDDETSIDLVLDREPFPLLRQLDTQHYGRSLWMLRKHVLVKISCYTKLHIMQLLTIRHAAHGKTLNGTEASRSDDKHVCTNLIGQSHNFVFWIAFEDMDLSSHLAIKNKKV